MKSKKAVGLDGIPIEVCRYLGKIGVTWLIDVFKKIQRTNKMSNGWRRRTLVLIYKNKGDVRDCSNS